jgi:hypothetical protein
MIDLPRLLRHFFGLLAVCRLLLARLEQYLVRNGSLAKFRCMEHKSRAPNEAVPGVFAHPSFFLQWQP